MVLRAGYGDSIPSRQTPLLDDFGAILTFSWYLPPIFYATWTNILDNGLTPSA
jgi:hypothetical protein